jgi:Protein of unknown function (DUF3267).
MSFKISWVTHLKCFIIAIVLTKLLGDNANTIVKNFIFKDFISYPTGSIIINFYIYVILIMIPISCVHEAIHGITYKLFGGKVKFGFKGIYAYTQEISELPIHRYKFQIILLCPLFFISLLTLLLPSWLGGMIFFLNLLGASGDIYMCLYVFRYKYYNKIVDRKYGFDIVEIETKI